MGSLDQGIIWTVDDEKALLGGVEFGETTALSIWKRTRFGDRGLLVGRRKLL